MKRIAVALAVLMCAGAPALAGSDVTSTDKPIVLAQSSTTTIIRRDARPSVVVRERRRHFMARDRGCRTVTVRERRGHRVIVKRIRRC